MSNEQLETNVEIELDGKAFVTEDLTSSIDFEDLKPIEVPVRFKGVDYVLRTATAASVIKYRGACMSAARFNEAGKATGVDGKRLGAEIDVVVENLFPVVENSKTKVKEPRRFPVTKDVIEGAPYEVQDTLFIRLQKITPKMSADDTEANLLQRLSELYDRLKKLRENKDVVKN